MFSKLDNAERGPRYASNASESPVETWHPQALNSLTPGGVKAKGKRQKGKRAEGGKQYAKGNQESDLKY
jgi:hypothetical protein